MMTAKKQSCILKTLKLLENIFVMFAERNETEAWKEVKSEILFRPVDGGPSIFASMV